MTGGIGTTPATDTRAADTRAAGARAADALALVRLSGRRTGAVRAVAGWLAERVGGTAAVLAGDGTVLEAAPAPPAGWVADAVRATHRRGVASGVTGAPDGGVAHIVALGGEPYLVVTAPGRADAALIADAATVLRLCWHSAESEHRRRRSELAEAHSREAVLHLLMSGRVGPAHRIAAAMGTRLSATIRVCIVECERRRRAEVAKRLARLDAAVATAEDDAAAYGADVGGGEVVDGAGVHEVPRAAGKAAAGDAGARRAGAEGSGAGGASADRAGAQDADFGNANAASAGGASDAPWIVPCPVRRGHLIVLIPATADAWERAVAEREPGCRIGGSGTVALREAALGYEQAFHALAVARGGPRGWARFDRGLGPVPVLGPAATGWAGALLRPCLAYVPARRSDPGAAELLDTLGSWLTFGVDASVHLKIHRNTLAGRVRLLHTLLGLDLSGSLREQSAAWLASRVHAAQGGVPVSGPPPGPEDAYATERDAYAAVLAASAGFRSEALPRSLVAADPVGGAGARPALAGLDALLDTPAVRAWAREQWAPLGDPDGAVPEAVFAWLRADTRLPSAAAELGLSLPGARKRLARAEHALGRSLTRAPSAKYELWLAARALGWA
jgi:hypothetical protein